VVLVNSLIYLALLTAVLNVIIFLTKRDRKVFIDK
jgi:hypothetical protein